MTTHTQRHPDRPPRLSLQAAGLDPAQSNRDVEHEPPSLLLRGVHFGILFSLPMWLLIALVVAKL